MCVSEAVTRKMIAPVVPETAVNPLKAVAGVRASRWDAVIAIVIVNIKRTTARTVGAWNLYGDTVPHNELKAPYRSMRCGDTR